MTQSQGMALSVSTNAPLKNNTYPKNDTQLDSRRLYCLTIHDTPKRELHITNFTIKEHGLMQCYRIKLTLLRHECLEQQSCLGKRATLKINNDYRLHGYITKIQNNQLTLASPLYRLCLPITATVYHNKTIVELIKAILQKLGFANHEFGFKLVGHYAYPKQAMWVQYKETDYQFLYRHMAFWGLLFYLIQESDWVRLIITDDIRQITNKRSIILVNDSGQMTNQEIAYEFRTQFRLVSNTIKVNSYRYLAPQLDLTQSQSNNTNIVGWGTVYDYGANIKTIADAEHIAKIQQQTLDCQRVINNLKTNVTGLHPGMLVELNMNHSDEFIKSHQLLRIISITHFGAVNGNNNNEGIDSVAEDRMVYHNELQLIPANLAYHVVTPARISPGYLIATIAGHESRYPVIDEWGRYRVRFSFDDARQITLPSVPVRMRQSLAGQATGQHFPLHVGTKVLLTFINDDIDQPVIIGVIPDSKSVQEKVLVEPNQYKLSTARGNSFIVDDSQATSHIRLATPSSKSSITMHTSADNKDINLESLAGDIEFNVGKNTMLGSEGDINYQIGGDSYHQVGGQSRWQSQYGNLIASANRDIYYHAVKYIEVKSRHDHMNLHCGRNIKVSAYNESSIQAENNINFDVRKGKLQCQGQSLIIIQCQGDGDIIVTQGRAQLKITAQGDINISAPIINLSADVVRCAGLQTYMIPNAKLTKPYPHPKLNYLSWINLQYKVANYKYPIINQAIEWHNKDSHKHSTELLTKTDDQGYAPLACLTDFNIDQVRLPQCEMISKGSDTLAYPQTITKVNQADLVSIKTKPNTNTHINIKEGDRVLNVECLFPPVIINLREHHHDQNSRELLSNEELAYFKNNGNNATLFIHGFNVPYGHFSKTIVGFEKHQDALLNRYEPTQILVQQPIYGESYATIFRDAKMLCEQFPELKQTLGFNQEHSGSLRTTLQKNQALTSLNGSGAHNWFLHMEDNLNRATGRFNRDHYNKFTRLINVTWTGNPYQSSLLTVINYMSTEEYANRAGHRMVSLIKQLTQAGITINIIAHSLGNRVLLTALNELGKQFDKPCVEQVFLWQAAVPDTALSNDPKLDTSIKQNCHFPTAYMAANRFTVLYSFFDIKTLDVAYTLANDVGIAPDKFFSEAGHNIFQLYQRSYTKQELATIEEYYHLLHNPSQEPGQSTTSNFFERYLRVSTDVDKLISRHKIRMAMGLVGVDPSTKALLGDRLLSVNQSLYLFSHSGMRNPNHRMMEHVYQEYIINKQRGIKQFGSY